MNKPVTQNLKDYILHLDNWIPKNTLTKTIKELNSQNQWEPHRWTNLKSHNPLDFNRGKKELEVSLIDNLSNRDELMSLTWKAIEKYVVIEKIGGNLFKGWKGFSKIRFNKYSQGQSMAKHYDHITSVFDGKIKGIPILSIVGVLNDNYKGGEFIMFDNYEIKFKAGDIIIFPSIFLYPHLVKSVKKGTRYSFVSWVY
tara:strand:- start:683 stop:1276 length:594 start_codon:yes stop_codon:yes gene_type:complete